MKKNKIAKIIFVLSFLPYVILILISLYHAIFGYDVYTLIKPQYIRTSYGTEAFGESLVWNSLVLCVIPVLPIVLIYQIIYIVIKIIIKLLKRNKKINK